MKPQKEFDMCIDSVVQLGDMLIAFIFCNLIILS